MHLLLFVIGLALAAAGVAMLRFAVPIDDVVGAALFTSGVVALVGALLMMAIALALRTINRIFERLYIQPLPLPPLAALERDDPAPRAVRQAQSEGALRPSTLLGWLGSSAATTASRSGSTPETELPETSPASAPAIDLTALARIPEPPREAPAPPPPPPPTPSSLRPQMPAARPQLPPLPTPVPPLTRAPPPPPPLSPPPPRSRPKASAAAKRPDSEVYRSGVIDGMSYSLFMDGSIQAELPQGTVKFASVDELQRYLLITSPD